MIRSLYTASTAMYAQQFNMDTVSNNLSNVNTAGFKKSRPVFQDLLYSQVPSPDISDVPATLQLGTGVRVVSTSRNFSDGPLLQTDEPLDVALQGPGFMVVGLPDGSQAYTRNGALRISDGQLLDSSGYSVLDERGRKITVPDNLTGVCFDDAGQLIGYDQNGEEKVVAQLGIGNPLNPQAMQAIGGGLYTTAEDVDIDVPRADGRARIVPRYLEMANVQVVEEMVNLISAQRAYEAGSKLVQAADEMLGQANNLRR
jgi:flagellar basal-body rod protein FlgG